MPKHTSGPWEVRKKVFKESDGYTWLTYSSQVFIDSPEGDVAIVECAEGLENAALIAASPVGFELAELVLKWDAHGKFVPPTIAAKAREFMAKATTPSWSE